MKPTRPQSSIDPDYNRQLPPSSYTAGSHSVRFNKGRGTGSGHATTPPVQARTFPFVVTSGQKVLGNDVNRRGLFIQNIGANNVYLTFDSEAQIIGSTLAGHLIAPGFSYEAPAGWAPINDVWLQADGTGSLVVVTESVIR